MLHIFELLSAQPQRPGPGGGGGCRAGPGGRGGGTEVGRAAQPEATKLGDHRDRDRERRVNFSSSETTITIST